LTATTSSQRRRPSSRFPPSTSTSTPPRRRSTAAAAAAPAAIDVDAWATEESKLRSEFLEQQARRVLRRAAAEASSPAFPCALIAGDIVIVHLLATEGLLGGDGKGKGKIPVIFIDTFHLFPETHELLAQLEDLYNFKAHVFKPKGFENKKDYAAKHGSDLFLTDIELYDQICKVEPFSRALDELHVDVMINGRRRDHGAERAHLRIADLPSRKGAPVNVQPLAWWEFEDCMRYLDAENIPKHPLFDQGFPSVGDVHSTLPVPKEKWFEHGGERSGRFVGLTNADGSVKTECGIHVGGGKA